MSIVGNRTLSGTWGMIWWDGDPVFDFKKIDAKVTAEREDVQLGIDVDSKLVGLKGEGTLTLCKTYTRTRRFLEAWKKGKDLRSQITTKLADPDAVGEQLERHSINNVWFNELPIAVLEKGGAIEEEIGFGFTPSDLQCLDEIKKL